MKTIAKKYLSLKKKTFTEKQFNKQIVFNREYQNFKHLYNITDKDGSIYVDGTFTFNYDDKYKII